MGISNNYTQNKGILNILIFLTILNL